jgi:plastocyanin
MMMRYLRIAAAGALAAIAVAACSSNDTPSSSATTSPPANVPTTSSDTSAPTTTGGSGDSAATGTITIQGFKFGAPLTVKPGATVTVTNQDTAGHNVVADDASAGFKTDVLQKGDSGTFTAPTKAGTYKYSCTLHANMTGTGTLIVAP